MEDRATYQAGPVETSFVAALKDRTTKTGAMQVFNDLSSDVLLEMPASEIAGVMKLNLLHGKAFHVTIKEVW